MREAITRYTHDYNELAGIELHNFVQMGYFPKKTLHMLILHFLE
jgi:hypothetical protein